MDPKLDRKSSPPVLMRIKKEPNSSSDEMKEFAETAMNELLGWYGYDDRPDDEDDDDSDTRHRNRITEDSSGPECSDSGGGGSGNGSWCGWCSRPMFDGAQTTGAFCSELCFSQSRRASFKRNRTCDWCRRVRHTITHVDVKDGARHLQFCSDKCLNQYKMHIFCRETRAHLEMHPHSSTPASGDCSSDASLITPDLWFKDCKEKSPPILPVREVPRRRCSTTRKTRTNLATVTSTATSTTTSTNTNMEAPQDLRVRARSPPVNVTQPVNKQWPPPPPPVTVLVPYPVVVPVPVPLPLPIPIPIPEEVFKQFTNSTQSQTLNNNNNNNNNNNTKSMNSTLRKRKRTSDDNGRRTVLT